MCSPTCMIILSTQINMGKFPGVYSMYMYTTCMYNVDIVLGIRNAGNDVHGDIPRCFVVGSYINTRAATPVYINTEIIINTTLD